MTVDRIILIGFLCALTVGGQAPPPRRSAPPNRQKQTRPNEIKNVPAASPRDIDPVASAIDELSSQIKAWKDQQASQDAQNHSLYGPANVVWWTIASAVASAVAAILIAVWAGFQLAAMNKQRRAMHLQARYMGDMLQALQQAAEVAVISARSTEKSLNVMMDKQRARLELTPLFDSMNLRAENAGVSVRIRNSGETDAIGVKSKATCDVSGRSNAPKDPADWHHSNRLEPGQEDSLDVLPAPPITEEELEAIRRGEQTIRVSVKTEFSDVFGIKRHLHATYRLEAILPKGMGAPRFDWVRNPARSFETEERDHPQIKAPAARHAPTESGSLLKL